MGAMAAMGFDQGGLYSPHAFRRGATQGNLDHASTLATIIRSGASLSACYKNYHGMKSGEAINISTLLLGKLGPDSEEPDPDPTAKRRKRAAKRIRKTPLTFGSNNTRGESGSSDLFASDSD